MGNGSSKPVAEEVHMGSLVLLPFSQWKAEDGTTAYMLHCETVKYGGIPVSCVTFRSENTIHTFITTPEAWADYWTPITAD